LLSNNLAITGYASDIPDSTCNSAGRWKGSKCPK
jgi:hypothetical protein